MKTFFLTALWLYGATSHPTSTSEGSRPPKETTTPGRERPLSCGGFAPQINPCPKPLVCAPTQPPMTADFPGECVLQTCGGKTQPPLAPCPLGQVCVYNATSPITDIPGRCMAAMLDCGGEKRMECKSGWQCVLHPKVDFFYADEFRGEGICIPPGSLVVKLPWKGWD